MTDTTPCAYSVERAIDVLATSRRTIYEVIRTGELRTYTVGRRRYISAEAVREFIARREAATAAERAA